jgi:hypothetical protein
MAETKLKNLKARMPAGALNGTPEVVTLANTSQDLAAHGATIPSGTTRIVAIPLASGALHHHPRGTVSTTFGHAVQAFEMFVLEADQLASKVISDSGTPDIMLIYLA